MVRPSQTKDQEIADMRYLTLFLTCLLSMQAWALEYPEARPDNTTNTYQWHHGGGSFFDDCLLPDGRVESN